jgi:hypothetical protein
MTTQTIEQRALTAKEITVEEMRALAGRAARRHPNFSDSDDVFIAFARGQERSGCAASAEYVDDDYGVNPDTQEPINPPHVLRSHGVPIAVRMNDWVAIASKPAAPGQPCLGRIMAHVGRAAVFVHAVFADDRVLSFDRAGFAELCRDYRVEEQRPMRQDRVRCECSQW